MQTSDIQYICLGGGGVRGMAYSAALDELQQLLRFDFGRLKGVAGTSIGALFAAALASKMNTKELLNISRQTSLIDLVSPHVSNLFSHNGLDVGGTVESWIDTFLGSRNKTFQQLYDETQIQLKVFATCLNTCESHAFSHTSHPNMSVAKAVFISMCLPPLFSPVQFDGSLYVDGGLLQNFPIRAFDDEEHTIGFTVKWGLTNSSALSTFEGYFSRLTYCTLSAGTAAQFEALPEGYKERTIDIDCGDVSTLNYRVPIHTAVAMESRGRESVRDFVKKFDLRALPFRDETSVARERSVSVSSVGTQTEGGSAKCDVEAGDDGCVGGG